MSFPIKKICCIGAGYVGGPTMSVIADQCPDLEVKVVDINPKRISEWNSKNLKLLPVFEPGLDQIIKRVRDKNLFFTTEVNDAIKNADMIFISVNTPIKSSGLGAGEASDLKWVEASARRIASHAQGHTIVVEKSTLPVRTAEVIQKILCSSNENKDKFGNKTFSVLSNPEFLAEGTAINDLEKPDRVLIGGDNPDSIRKLKEIYLNWVPCDKILTSNLWSSELSKLTSNAFLAQRVSSINSVSAICEATGGNVKEVAEAIGLDHRVGKLFLSPGPGFGGSCFKKDILNLVYLCKQFNLIEVANYWQQVIILNDWQKKRIYTNIVKSLFGNLSDKKITILGFAFKSNTNDTRDSPAIQLSIDLLNEDANLIFNDPKVTKEQIIEVLKNEKSNFKKYDKNLNKKLFFEQDIYKSIINSDAIILITDWEEYTNLNWQKISNLMRKPSWVFDTRAILDSKKVRKAGINLWQVGEGNFKR